MCGTDDDVRGWYEGIKVRECRPLADDFPELASVLIEELRRTPPVTEAHPNAAAERKSTTASTSVGNPESNCLE
jgi:hypothetical protein